MLNTCRLSVERAYARPPPGLLLAAMDSTTASPAAEASTAAAPAATAPDELDLFDAYTTDDVLCPPVEVLCFAPRDVLCRPCVDCGRRTGRFCDYCYAADRIPSEKWGDGQHTPLCSDCDIPWPHMCHYCRGVHMARPFEWGAGREHEEANPFEDQHAAAPAATSRTNPRSGRSSGFSSQPATRASGRSSGFMGESVRVQKHSA